MTALLYLIPISILLGGVALVVFLWTVRNGQYDDLEGAAVRILTDEDKPLPRPSEEEDTSSRRGNQSSLERSTISR